MVDYSSIVRYRQKISSKVCSLSLTRSMMYLATFLVILFATTRHSLADSCEVKDILQQMLQAMKTFHENQRQRGRIDMIAIDDLIEQKIYDSKYRG